VEYIKVYRSTLDYIDFLIIWLFIKRLYDVSYMYDGALHYYVNCLDPPFNYFTAHPHNPNYISMIEK